MRFFALAFAVAVAAATAHAATFGDDFNDNFKDPAKWGADIGTAGTIVEDFEVIGYTFQNAVVAGSMIRPWILNDLPYDADWVVELDVFASCSCQAPTGDEYFAFGLLVWNTADMFDQLELANYQRTGPIQGWEAAMRTDGAFDSNVETPLNISNTAKLQITYDSAARVVSLNVGTSTPTTWPPVPDTWRPFGTFGVQGTGGATANNDWMMTTSDTFSVGMFGSVVANGSFITTATADLFSITIPDPPPGTCGDPTGNGITATDALFTLQAAIGLQVCEPCLCDADGNASVTATDALRVLNAAVGQPLELLCPVCSA